MLAALLAQTPLPDLRFPEVAYSAIGPELVLVGSALLLLLLTSLLPKRPPAGTYAVYSLLTCALAGVSAFDLWDSLQDGAAARTAFDGAVAVDGFAVFFKVVILVAVALTALLADSYLRREGLDGPELHVLTMLSASGGMLMAAANDMIVLFLGLEILSIALYVLAGFHSRRESSREAALKYFVLGSFSSALFLYGVALAYGATGSTNFAEIATYLAENIGTSGLLLAGVGLLLVGLGFKVAAVPFHAWTPDVYQGSPTPVTGFMAAAAKAAGFAGLLRLLYATFGALRLDWRPLVLALAVATLLVGSVIAVVQTDIKRMLAYSSISHAGYVLIGLQAASDEGIAGSLFYLLAYTFMALGSFAIVTVVGGRGDAGHDLDSYKGLAGRRPGLALAFAVLLMSQAGVPFTSGFFAKFYVIKAAVESESYALALVGMLGAVVAAFFYLRVIVLMYMAGADEGARRITIPVGIGAALAVTVAFTLLVGVAPAPVIEFARSATLLF